MDKERVVNIILRAGVAFAFLYPAFDALLDPTSWMGYFPGFVRVMAQAVNLPDAVLLHGFGLLEVVIALWILSGKKIFLPSLAATALLVAIIFLNLQDFQVIFRDVSIAAGALALAVTSYRSTPSGSFPGQR